MRTRPFIAVNVVSMALVAAIVAPDPASSGTIYQCAKNNTGQLRLVNAPSDCLPSETSIVLNNQIVVHGSVFFTGFGNFQVVTNGAIGFSLEKVIPGQFVITFDSALPAAPTCQASTINPPVPSSSAPATRLRPPPPLRWPWSAVTSPVTFRAS